MTKHFSKYHLHITKVILFLLLFAFNAYSKEELFIIEGIVLNAETSEPVSNAVVLVVGTNNYITTKSDGTFSLQVNSTGTIRIKITHLAYQEKLIDINTKMNQKRIL